MIETTLPLAPDLWARVPAPDHVSPSEELATLRLENAAILLAGWFNPLSRFLQSTRVEREAPGAVAQRTGPV